MDMRDLELRNERSSTVHVRRGDAVEALAGTIWLTQEGMLEDVILTPGQRFVAAERGTVVLSAMNAPAVVRFGGPQHDMAPQVIEPGHVVSIHAHARELRRAEFAHLAHAAYAAVARILGRVRDTLRGHESDRTRVRPCAHGGRACSLS